MSIENTEFAQFIGRYQNQAKAAEAIGVSASLVNKVAKGHRAASKSLVKKIIMLDPSVNAGRMLWPELY